MAPIADVRVQAELRVLEIDEVDTWGILEAHALLQEVLGTEGVEEIDSFNGTVSSSTDGAVTPKMVRATYGQRMEGVVLGAYLSNLNMGMILYSAVRSPFRGRGVYSTLRAELVTLLSSIAARHQDGEPRSKEQGTGMRYLLSELEPSSRLCQTYLRRWGAFVAPCEYEQPKAQGLPTKKLVLMLQPLAQKTPPTREETAAIVREIYERVYRLSDVTQSANFRRVVESMGAHIDSSYQELR
jgi:hypothetical protein